MFFQQVDFLCGSMGQPGFSRRGGFGRACLNIYNLH
jgi:hypothetical protein